SFMTFIGLSLRRHTWPPGPAGLAPRAPRRRTGLWASYAARVASSRRAGPESRRPSPARGCGTPCAAPGSVQAELFAPDRHAAGSLAVVPDLGDAQPVRAHPGDVGALGVDHGHPRLDVVAAHRSAVTFLGRAGRGGWQARGVAPGEVL